MDGGTTTPTEPADTQPSLRPDAPAQSGVDRFDETISVARPLAWLGLAACAALIIGVAAWAVFGSVRTTATATGIAIRGGSLEAATSPAAGQVQTLTVERGDTISEGDVVGTVIDAQDSVHEVVSSSSGVAIELIGGAGAVVAEGQSVVWIDQVDESLRVRAFADPGEGQRIQPGMLAIVDFASGEELDGQVASVDSLLSDLTDISSELGHFATAESLADRRETVLGITIELEANRDVLDSIPSGSLAAVQVVIGSERPLNYVL